jgi:hypothetical protein
MKQSPQPHLPIDDWLKRADNAIVAGPPAQ